MVFLIPILLLINLWIFIPFFGLGLFGDDWLAIFRYSYYLDPPKHLGLYSTEYFNSFKYLLNAYGTQDTIMAFLYKAFRENSSIYFLISYLLRLVAALSIYLPAFFLTRSRLVSWFAVLFFLFSSVGLGASTWVFNMPSYLAITFFNFLLYFYLKHHEDHKIKTITLSYLFFTLTFLSTPIRAHGLIPYLIFLEIIWLVFEKKRPSFKIGLRISGFLAIYFVIYLLGFKETLSGNPTIGFIISIKDKLQLLNQNNFDFLFYPIAILGNILIPDSFFPHGWQITSTSQYLFRIFLPIFLICITIVFFLTRHIVNLSRKFFPVAVLTEIFWTITVLTIYKLSPATFSNANNVSSLLTGGYFLIIILTMFICLKTNHSLKIGLLITLGWTIISYLYPWWQTNTSAIFPTTHRYLIISSVGISLLLAKVISLGKNTKSVFTLLAVTTLLLITHTFYTRFSLDEEYKTHNRDLVKKIWSQIPYIEEVKKSTESSIFYFEGDNTNESILRDSITFGFPPHMALLYGITEESMTPQPMSDWTKVQSAVRNRKSINIVYAFKLQGKDQLINITNVARMQLRKIL